MALVADNRVVRTAFARMRRFRVSLALIVASGCFLAGCYSFSGARDEIRKNNEEVRRINTEILTEKNREQQFENSTNHVQEGKE